MARKVGHLGNRMFKRLAVVLLLVVLGHEARAEASVCHGEMTPQVEACLRSRLSDVEVELQHYTDAAIRRIGEEGAASKEYGGQDDSAEILAAFHKAEAAWADYRRAACDAVYESWSTGTIRGAMALTCETRITEERTHEVWRNWLTYMDRTPPVLPEPVVEAGR